MSNTAPEVDFRFPLLFDDPLYGGNFVPLVLEWSDEQLASTVRRIDHLLRPNLTDAMQLAVAACARSLAVEKVRTGSGLHYARAKDAYRGPRRYRSHDARHTWHFVFNSMNILLELGLAEGKPGQRVLGRKGFQSVAWATDELLALLRPHLDVDEPRALLHPEEVIVLRDRKDRHQIDYSEDATTTEMRRGVHNVNRSLAQLDVRLDGERLRIPRGRRIFNGTFGRGGRFYCHGDSFQNMPAFQRRQLKFLVMNEAHAAVEVDFSSLHVDMAHQEEAVSKRSGDQYAIDGFSRSLVKVAVNVVLNAATEHAAILAITEGLHSGKIGAEDGFARCTRREGRALAHQLVAAIKRKHWKISNYFGSDCGARFQRRDSDMAMQIMQEMIRKTGRCPLPVHDSFLVADIDEEALVETMQEAARAEGLRPTLKLLRPGEEPAFLYMEVRPSEQVRHGHLETRVEWSLTDEFMGEGSSKGQSCGVQDDWVPNWRGPPSPRARRHT